MYPYTDTDEVDARDGYVSLKDAKAAVFENLGVRMCCNESNMSLELSYCPASQHGYLCHCPALAASHWAACSWFNSYSVRVRTLLACPGP